MSIAARCVHGTGLCVLPSPDNDYRPLVLRHRPLAFISVLLIAAKVLALGVVALTPAPAELSTITADRIVQMTNAERSAAGLAPLKVNARLTQAAQAKGAHMLEEDYFAHISPSGVTPWFWIQKAGYSYQVAGENLAIDFVEAEDVVAAWIASPTHKENIMHSTYTETGVAVVTGEFQGGTSIVVVHMFGLPVGGAAPTTPATTPTEPTTTPAPATPAPTLTPSPSPTSTPAPLPAPDTTPPRTPRIAADLPSGIAQSTVPLTISGEGGSIAHIMINNALAARVAIPTQGSVQYEVDVAGVTDGTLVVQSFATDSAENKSTLSEALVLTKDTASPEIDPTRVTFYLSPLIDTPQALVSVASDDYTDVSIAGATEDARVFPAGEPAVISAGTGQLTLTVKDAAGNVSTLEHLHLVPQFAIETDQAYLAPPSRLSALTRRLALSFGVLLISLLGIAVFAHIHIQRPTLIAHTAAVLGLALLLFVL